MKKKNKQEKESEHELVKYDWTKSYFDTAYTFSMDLWDTRTPEEMTLDDIDIKTIEKYLRKKKIENLPKN